MTDYTGDTAHSVKIALQRITKRHDLQKFSIFTLFDILEKLIFIRCRTRFKLSLSLSQKCDCVKQLGTRERKTVAIRLNLCTNFPRRHSAPDCLLNSAAALATTDIKNQCTLIVQSSVNIRWTLCASVNNNGWH